MTIEKQRVVNLLVRVQDEFLDHEVPLTAAEVQQLAGGDAMTCQAVLDLLVEAGVLVRLDDLYFRASLLSRQAPPAPGALAA
jgi:hypothetical protein